MLRGRITLVDGHWHIACQADVRTKLKRLFPQVDQRASETIRLSNSPAHCRDLLWFIERHPMSVEPLGVLQHGAAAHVELEDRTTALLEARHPPEHFDLALPARDYQQVAGSLVMLREGVLIADDVGLGKTVSSICPMVHPENLPVLVVTLTHLPTQWAAEIRRFAPSLKIHVLKTAKPYDLVPKRVRRSQQTLFSTAEAEEAARLPDVIITSYSKLNGWAETLAGVIRYVVFDEGQELRRNESAKYAAAKFIAGRAHRRCALTATPIYNLGIEFFHVLNVIAPDALGTREEFIREWCKDEKSINDPKAFGEHLRREGLMIRRTRKDVGRELPPLSIIPQTVECDTAALARIKGSAVELARIILAQAQRSQSERFRASGEFDMLLRQSTGIAKAPYVAEFVRMLVESGQKVILYGWHRAVYDLWMTALKEFKPRLYTGTESTTQKEDAKNAFINGDCQILIVSLRSGAGLDGLQNVCWTVVFGELDWSSGVHKQCIGRADRDGQLNPVMAYFLISDEGSDPIVADMLGLKRQQLEGVINPDGDLVEELQAEQGGVRRLAESYLRQHGMSVPAG